MSTSHISEFLNKRHENLINVEMVTLQQQLQQIVKAAAELGQNLEPSSSKSNDKDFKILLENEDRITHARTLDHEEVTDFSKFGPFPELMMLQPIDSNQEATDSELLEEEGTVVTANKLNQLNSTYRFFYGPIVEDEVEIE